MELLLVWLKLKRNELDFLLMLSECKLTVLNILINSFFQSAVLLLLLPWMYLGWLKMLLTLTSNILCDMTWECNFLTVYQISFRQCLFFIFSVHEIISENSQRKHNWATALQLQGCQIGNLIHCQYTLQRNHHHFLSLFYIIYTDKLYKITKRWCVHFSSKSVCIRC